MIGIAIAIAETSKEVSRDKGLRGIIPHLSRNPRN